jgi:hypothetical protein
MWLSQVFGGATMCGISVISSAIPFRMREMNIIARIASNG